MTHSEDHDQRSHELRSHHVVIAGTGRAGTTFLVQFLQACGLDAGAQGESSYFSRARAGLEHCLISDEALPYVVKDPLLHEYCQSLDLETIAIDALIVPVRDLTAAATSRVLQERIRIVETGSRHRPASNVEAITPGGMLISLDVTDQARLLATGFYELLFWSVASEIPLFLLEFPRLVEDEGYLVRGLQPWLGAHCDEDRATKAFQGLADPGRVRVVGSHGLTGASVLADSPSYEELDRAAMVALLDEQSSQLAARQRDLVNARSTSDALFTSKSWRLTRPLRVLSSFLRRLNRGGSAATRR